MDLFFVLDLLLSCNLVLSSGLLMWVELVVGALLLEASAKTACMLYPQNIHVHEVAILQIIDRKSRTATKGMYDE